MRNQQVSDLFEEMADIMEILGEDHFRVNTYRKVARVIQDCAEDVAVLATEGRLEELPGIGKSSAEKINEFVHRGAITAHQNLLKKIPPGLLKMLEIPGMGPKGVAAVWKGLKAASPAELLKAIENHKLEKLAGFGEKKAEALARGIKFLEGAKGRILLSEAALIADEIMARMKQTAKLERIEPAGSLRRCCETVGDIDLLVQGGGKDDLIKIFTSMNGVKEVHSAGQTKASIHFAEPQVSAEVVQVDLRIIPAESMGAASQYFTGSKYHNVRLREIAGKKKFKLNEYGLFRGDKKIAGENEEEIYQHLGMDWILPTLREDRGEIELAQQGKLPVVVELEDVRADLHMHTPESDGRATIEELAAAAKKRGYKYIAITDHSQSTVIANGLSEKRLLQHIKRIKAANKKLKGFTVLAASEVDILPDGTLDYPDEILEQLDFVMASVHSGMKGDQDKVTQRVLRAMENPYVNCIGHPTGRMINVREAMQLDIKAIIGQAAKTGTALEVNANPLRLDLNDIHCRMAVDAGVKLIISTDAHDVESLDFMRYGVATAQRGWVKKTDVLNCQPLGVLREWIKKKRPPK